jgi:uncharacterized protein YjbJ (UPF0337 family)
MIAARVGLRIVRRTTTTTGGAVMGGKTDQVVGRAKKSFGAITGDQDMKGEGQAQEDMGKAKSKVDSAVDKTQESLKGLKKAVKHE